MHTKAKRLGETFPAVITCLPHHKTFIHRFEILFWYISPSLLTPSYGLPELSNSVEYGDEWKILQLKGKYYLVSLTISADITVRWVPMLHEWKGRRCLLLTPVIISYCHFGQDCGLFKSD